MNREHIVPHTIALPIELYPPKLFNILNIYIYLGMIRTFNIKYQKFMTYLLVYGILILIFHKTKWIYNIILKYNKCFYYIILFYY